MDVLLLTLSAARGEQLAQQVEDAGEKWRCLALRDGRAGWQALSALHPAGLLVEEHLPGLDGAALLSRLWAEPPCPPPLVLYRGAPCRPVDAALPSSAGERALGEALMGMLASRALPVLCQPLLPGLMATGAALLDELGMKPGLKGRGFLPAAVALCAACPALLADVTGRLYPLLAARTGLTPGAVERDMRSAIESLWSGGDLTGLERRFGHTVDPEKGRPTNRAFLATLSEQAARCIYSSS